MMHDQLQPTENSQSWLERNKATVLDFIEKSVNQGNIDAASVHFGESYTQHNPNIADGVRVSVNIYSSSGRPFRWCRARSSGFSRMGISSSCICTPGASRRKPGWPS